MKKLKKGIKLIAFICLIVLAGVGIGISGGAPIPLLKNRREAEKETIELVESKDLKSDPKLKLMEEL